MSKQIIKGDELQLFLNDSAPLYATSHTLTITGSSVDRSTKDDGFWGSSQAGNLTWELTAECLYSDAQYDLMFDMMVRHQKQLVKFAKVQNYSVNGLISVGGDVDHWIPENKGFTGYAVVTSLTANANTGENSTYSITFTGAGPLNSFSNITTDNYIDVQYYDLEAGQSYKLWNGTSIAGASGEAIALSTNTPVSFSSRENVYTPSENLSELNLRIYLRNTSVPSNLFENTPVAYIEIGETITELGVALCAGCTHLEAAVLNENVSLSYRLFAGCEMLNEITLPQEQAIVYNSNSLALSGCDVLSIIYVPSSLVEWYQTHEPWSNLEVNSIS